MAGDDQTVTAGESAACAACGSFDAWEIGDRKLCADCITLAGSACGGSASDDDE
jgi:hypothetical protein